MSSADQDIERLKASTKRLEEKINDLIERSPALRRAHALAEVERLRARDHVAVHG